MIEKSNNILKINMGYELAYEIILNSLIIIALGIASLFATNLLRFNWWTVFFISLSLLLFYLKYNSYILLGERNIQFIIFNFFIQKEIRYSEINEITFYKKKRIVKFVNKNKKIHTVYLSKKNKHKLLEWIINNEPTISCLYFQND